MIIPFLICAELAPLGAEGPGTKNQQTQTHTLCLIYLSEQEDGWVKIPVDQKDKRQFKCVGLFHIPAQNNQFS